MNPKEEFIQQQMARGVTRQQAAIMWQEHIGNAQPISGTDSVPLQESLEAAVRATVEGPATLAGRAASTDPGMLALGGAAPADPTEFSRIYHAIKADEIANGATEEEARQRALESVTAYFAPPPQAPSPSPTPLPKPVGGPIVPIGPRPLIGRENINQREQLAELERQQREDAR